uniref:Uncharacterized protein n=1 Tax=Rangifer tarandus platyrhynchus TaxID=3082113 RepID=A0ACB0EV19_RANTA|nr:unnamed protein product [Rangifer tarandus platyrhynchus]
MEKRGKKMGLGRNKGFSFCGLKRYLDRSSKGREGLGVHKSVEGTPEHHGTLRQGHQTSAEALRMLNVAIPSRAHSQLARRARRRLGEQGPQQAAPTGANSRRRRDPPSPHVSTQQALVPLGGRFPPLRCPRLSLFASTAPASACVSPASPTPCLPATITHVHTRPTHEHARAHTFSGGTKPVVKTSFASVHSGLTLRDASAFIQAAGKSAKPDVRGLGFWKPFHFSPMRRVTCEEAALAGSQPCCARGPTHAWPRAPRLGLQGRLRFPGLAGSPSVSAVAHSVAEGSSLQGTHKALEFVKWSSAGQCHSV